MRSINPKQYDLIAKDYAGMKNRTKKYVLTPMFLDLVGDIRKKSVIDLACGEGFFTRILARMRPSEIIGVDISKKIIDLAQARENKDRLGIKYINKDVFELGPEYYDKKFDVVTAVYLLNYAKTKRGLVKMCNTVNQLLKKNGTFVAITLNPAVRPTKGIKYERKIVNVNGANAFKNGNGVKFEMYKKGKKSFEFICYYWSKKVYENCLREAGFKEIRWTEPTVSKEGIKKVGKKFWEGFEENPSPIGIVCRK